MGYSASQLPDTEHDIHLRENGEWASVETGSFRAVAAKLEADLLRGSCVHELMSAGDHIDYSLRTVVIDDDGYQEDVEFGMTGVLQPDGEVIAPGKWWLVNGPNSWFDRFPGTARSPCVKINQQGV